MYLMCSHIRSCLLNLQFRNSECCILSEKFPTTVQQALGLYLAAALFIHSSLLIDWILASEYDSAMIVMLTEERDH